MLLLHLVYFFYSLQNQNQNYKYHKSFEIDFIIKLIINDFLINLQKNVKNDP